MTKDEALQLIKNYCEYLKVSGEVDSTLTDLIDRFPDTGSEAKAMRWLGFIQGALYHKGLFKLDDLKTHNKYKYICSWSELKDFYYELDIKNQQIVMNLVGSNSNDFSRVYFIASEENCLAEFEFVILRRLVKKNFLKRKIEKLSKTFKYELLRKYDLVEGFSKSNLDYFEYLYRRVDYDDIFNYVEDNKFNRDVWKLL